MSRFGEARLLGTHGGGVECVRFANGRVYSAGLDKRLCAFDLAATDAGRVLRKFENVTLHPAWEPSRQHVLAFDFFDEGRKIACGLRNGRVEVLDAETGATQEELEFTSDLELEKTFSWHHVAVSPDGQWIAGTNGTCAAIWSARTSQVHWQTSNLRHANATVFGRTQLVALEWDPWFHLVELIKPQLGPELKFPGLWGNFVTAKFSPAGELIVALTGWDERDHKEFETSATYQEDDVQMDWDDEFHQRKLNGMPVEDGYVEVGQQKPDSGFLLGVDLAARKVNWQTKTPGRVHDFVFAGAHVISGGNSGQLELWKPGEDKPLAQMDLSRFAGAKAGPGEDSVHSGPDLHKVGQYPSRAIHSLALAPDGKSLAAGLAGGAVVVVELRY